jgi:hypothetical protein
MAGWPAARDQSVVLGALVGAVAGGVVMYTVILFQPHECNFDRGTGNCGFGDPILLGIGLGVGALIGTAVGALHPADR